MFSDGMSNRDISLLGIEIELFQGTYANELAEVCVLYAERFWTDPETGLLHQPGDYKCTDGYITWNETRMYC